MAKTKSIDKTTPEYRRLLEQESLILEATERITGTMQAKGITQTELAKRLGKSKGFVSQVLSGERNMTLRTLADVLGALDVRALIDTESTSEPRTYGSEASTTITAALAATPKMETLGARKGLLFYYGGSYESLEAERWRSVLRESLKAYQPSQCEHHRLIAISESAPAPSHRPLRERGHEYYDAILTG